MLKFLAVMNSTIRCFCYACNVALFASADALRRLQRHRIPHRRHRYQVKKKFTFISKQLMG